MTIEVTDAPSAEEITAVTSGLADFNDEAVGPANRRALAVLVKDGGNVKAGLIGYTARGALHVEKLWVCSELRGRGVGASLLVQAEKEALNRSCFVAWLDTLNPDAARLYRQLGYEPFGSIKGFPKGHERLFLKKDLVCRAD